MSAEARVAAADLRPRVHDDERPADEQDARHDRRSDRGGRSARAAGQDPLRLYLVKEVAFGGDGDFSWERYDERYNVDLANNLGNLVSRVTAMADGIASGRLTPCTSGSDQLAGWASRSSSTIARRWTRFALHEGAAAAFRLIDATNEFIAATAPWTLAKDPAAGGSADAGAVRRGGSDPARGGAARRRSCRRPAARSCGASAPTATGLNFDRDGRWRNDGERVLAQDGPLWPRLGPKETTTVTDNDIDTPAAAPAPRTGTCTAPRHRRTWPAPHRGTQHRSTWHAWHRLDRIASPSTTS